MVAELWVRRRRCFRGPRYVVGRDGPGRLRHGSVVDAGEQGGTWPGGMGSGVRDIAPSLHGRDGAVCGRTDRVVSGRGLWVGPGLRVWDTAPLLLPRGTGVAWHDGAKHRRSCGGTGRHVARGMGPFVQDLSPSLLSWTGPAMAADFPPPRVPRFDCRVCAGSYFPVAIRLIVVCLIDPPLVPLHLPKCNCEDKPEVDPSSVCLSPRSLPKCNARIDRRSIRAPSVLDQWRGFFCSMAALMI